MRHDTESGIGRSHRELFLRNQGTTSDTLNKSAAFLFDDNWHGHCWAKVRRRRASSP
jgi:hypothetical protein